MALSRSHRRDEVNFWPGFVDALSTMLIGIVFLLSVFVLGQFFLSQELTGKDTAPEVSASARRRYAAGCRMRAPICARC